MRSIAFLLALATTLLTARLGAACEVLVVGDDVDPLALTATAYRVDFASQVPANLRDSTYRVVIVAKDSVNSTERGALEEYASRTRRSGVIFQKLPLGFSWECAASGSSSYSNSGRWLDCTDYSPVETVGRALPGNVAGLPAGMDVMPCVLGAIDGDLPNSTLVYQMRMAVLADVGVATGLTSIRCQSRTNLRVAHFAYFPGARFTSPAPLLTRVLQKTVEWCAFGPPATDPCGTSGGTGGDCDLQPVLDAIDALESELPPACDLRPVMTQLSVIESLLRALTVASCDLTPVLAALDRLDGRVTTLSSEVADLRALVVSLQVQIDANTARVADLATSVDANTVSLGAVETSVDALGVAVDANTARMGAVEAGLAENTTQLAAVGVALDANTARLDGVEAGLADATARLSGVEAGVLDNSRRLGVVEAKLDDSLVRLQRIEDMLARLIAASCETMRLVTTPEGQRETDFCGGLQHSGNRH